MNFYLVVVIVVALIVMFFFIRKEALTDKDVDLIGRGWNMPSLKVGRGQALYAPSVLTFWELEHADTQSFKPVSL